MSQLVSPTVSNEIVIGMIKLLLESPWPPVFQLFCKHEPQLDSTLVWGSLPYVFFFLHICSMLTISIIHIWGWLDYRPDIIKIE